MTSEQLAGVIAGLGFIIGAGYSLLYVTNMWTALAIVVAAGGVWLLGWLALGALIDYRQTPPSGQ